ncbi:MAG: PPOX class F420-dependent oxidoreductase [bacterium]|nr:PPOX class F420-dependent oxidoreductase [bacterium]
MTVMSDAVRAFLDKPHFAVVATLTSEGLPHQTVIWYMRDGDDIIFSVPFDSMKHKHLKRDNRISLCMEEGFSYVTITGTAILEEDPQKARAEYGQLGIRYRGAVAMPTRPPSAESAELMSRERVGIRVKVDKIISQGVE